MTNQPLKVIKPPTEKLKPSTQRMRALIDRRKKGIELPHCDVCGAKCTAAESIDWQRCASCRRLTPEGRKKASEQFKLIYQRQKYLQKYLADLGVTLDPTQWTWNNAERSFPLQGTEVVAKTIRGALLIAKYYQGLGWLDAVDESEVQVAKWCVITVSEVS